MADKPARTLHDFGLGRGHAPALERHDDQARQDAAAHAGHAFRRSVPGHHDDGRIAAGARRAEAVAVIVTDTRRKAPDLLADPRRKIGVHDGRQSVARRDRRLAQQDVAALVHRGQFVAAAPIEQDGPVLVPPRHTRRAAIQPDPVQVVRHLLGRLGRRQGENVQLPRRQGHRAIGEQQGRILGLKIHRLRSHAEADFARHGTAVRAADDVVMAASLHDDAGRLDRPLARPPGLARILFQRRILEGPDRHVAPEAVVDVQVIAVARHRHLGSAFLLKGRRRRHGPSGAGAAHQGESQDGGRGEGVDAQGRSPEGRSARSLAVVNASRQLTVSSG